MFAVSYPRLPSVRLARITAINPRLPARLSLTTTTDPRLSPTIACDLKRPLIPTVRKSGVEILSHFFEKHRIIYIIGEITEEMATIINSQILYLEAMDAEKPIRLFIDSMGGSNSMITSSLQKATVEQKMADENVLRLLEEQKIERMANNEKMLQLERQLDAQQKLELQIEQLKGNLQVMQHMGNEDLDSKKKIVKMTEELGAKIEEMDYMQTLNQGLIIKECLSNDESQEARKELIMEMTKTLGKRAAIGIKRMGDLDEKPFREACKQKFAKDEADIKAAMLCSESQVKIKNPGWHPFKVIINDGKEKEILKEDDEKLQGLRNELELGSILSRSRSRWKG